MAVAKIDPIQDSINKIVSNVLVGRAFDSHYVIEELTRKYAFEYADFLHARKDRDIPRTHSHLSVLIRNSTAGGVRLVERLALPIGVGGRMKTVVLHSANVRKNSSANAAWLRI